MENNNLELEKINAELSEENDRIDIVLARLQEAIAKNNTHLENIKKYLGQQINTKNTFAKRLFFKIQKSLTKSQENNLTTTAFILKSQEEAKIYNSLYENPTDDDGKAEEQEKNKL